MMSYQDNLAAQRPVSQLTYEERQAHWRALKRDMPMAFGCRDLEAEYLAKKAAALSPPSKKEGER
jgi:hypothetical protein